MAEAKKEISRARALLDELKESAEGPVSRYLIAPEAEFVEASMVQAFVNGKRAPSMEDLEASPEAYILGLLDTVGELKRLVLTALLKNDMEKAQSFFAKMEELYSRLSSFAAYDHVVGGARRKIDVARMLVEDTRGLLTEETRRDRLVASMDRLYKKLSKA